MSGKKLWFLLFAFWICFLLTDNVQSQCSTHSPTEYGKNLVEHMTKDPPHRWIGTTMNYYVNNSTSLWYAADIAAAKTMWNNSAYKGTATAFRFVHAGGTTRSPDLPDLVNVVGFKQLGPGVGARARTWFDLGNGEIYEADMMINSLSWSNIQSHANAGSTDYCVRSFLAHEFGHWLGLSHLYETQSVEYIPDTMFYEIEKGEHKKEDLECDDKWGIWYTYDSGSVPSPNAPSVHHLLQSFLDRTPPHIEKGTIPTVTELVGNYPNPFNPETWIAYKLAQESTVTIRIYDTKGQVVCRLQLGKKPAGVYVEKESAAYWDGKTDTGEQVSSSMYFYSLLTDSAIYTKRMIIVK